MISTIFVALMLVFCYTCLAAVKTNPLTVSVTTEEVEDCVKMWLGNSQNRGSGPQARFLKIV
jgi:hypothetical protein